MGNAYIQIKTTLIMEIFVLLRHIRVPVMDRVPVLLVSVKLWSKKTMLLKQADHSVPKCLYGSH